MTSAAVTSVAATSVAVTSVVATSVVAEAVDVSLDDEPHDASSSTNGTLRGPANRRIVVAVGGRSCFMTNEARNAIRERFRSRRPIRVSPSEILEHLDHEIGTAGVDAVDPHLDEFLHRRWVVDDPREHSGVAGSCKRQVLLGDTALAVATDE